MIRRRKMPDGSDRPNSEQAAIDMIDRNHQREMAWAAGQIWLMERRMYEMSERCNKCPYRDCEGSGCHDEISY